MNNKLFYGDNLTVLRNLPSESVDLIYLDPPFNSKRNYNIIFETAKHEESLDQKQAFSDTWSNIGVSDTLFEIAERHEKLHRFLQTLSDLQIDNSSVGYLATMAVRILEMQRILKDTGSLYLHCDPTMSHYLKIILDMIFGRNNFINEIIWHYRRWTGKAKRFQKLHDVILFYGKTSNYNFNVLYTDYTTGSVERKMQGVLHRFKKGEKPILVSEKSVDEKGVRENDVWHIPFIAPSSNERLGYPTQKPLELLKRIVKASSNEGDIVLDPFCGCGTALDAAEGLKRNWIGIDITPLAVSLIERRLKDRYGSKLSPYEVHGFPTTIESAHELVKLSRYEFQDWVIEYLLGGVSNTTKVGDGGYDGYSAYKFDRETVKTIYEIKSGHLNKPMLTYFFNAMEATNADFGVFATLESPTAGMIEYANSCGFFKPDIYQNNYHKLQIITVEELLNGKQPSIPSMDTAHVKTADQKSMEKKQEKLF